MAVTPLSIPKTADGWLRWTRSPAEVRIPASYTTTQMESAVYDAVALGNPIAFECGAQWVNAPAFLLNKPVPYMTWYGNPANGRPAFYFDPNAEYGFKWAWGNQSLASVYIIGLYLDGAYNGDYLRPGSTTDRTHWIKSSDYHAIHFNSGNGTTTQPLVVVEDCHMIRWKDGVHFECPSATTLYTPGVWGAVVRRNIIVDLMSKRNQCEGVYLEGGLHGSLIEQNFVDYVSFLESYGRNQPGYHNRDGGTYSAHVSAHCYYVQDVCGKVVVRHNSFRKASAHTGQQRSGGDYLYNLGLYCALDSNVGYASGNEPADGYVEQIGNVFGRTEDINTAHPRGQGLIPSRAETYIGKQNILFARGGTGIGANGYGFGASPDAAPSGTDVASNVFVDWRHRDGTLLPANDGTNPREQVGGLTFRMKNVYYDIRPASRQPSEGSQVDAWTYGNAHTYSSNYDVLPPANYSAWPDITESDAATMRARGLGEWRPAIDHPGARINTARQLAKDMVLSQYGVNDTNLNAVTWSDNGSTSVGPGGSQSDGGVAEDDGNFIRYDGTTTDYAARIQEALADATAYTDIYFDTNTTYPITRSTLDTIAASSVTLHGPATLQITDPSTSGGAAGFVLADAIALDNLTIDSNGQFAGVDVTHAGASLTDVTVQDATAAGVRVYGFTSGSLALTRTSVTSGTAGSLGYIIDPGYAETAIPAVTMTDCSAEVSGTHIFVANTTTLTVNKYTHGGSPAASDGRTLVVGEKVGTINWSGDGVSSLPRGIAHDPDASATGSDRYVTNITFSSLSENLSLSASSGIRTWWSSLLATNIAFYDCSITGADVRVFSVGTAAADSAAAFTIARTTLGAASDTTSLGGASSIVEPAFEGAKTPTFNLNSVAVATTAEGNITNVSSNASIETAWFGAAPTGLQLWVPFDRQTVQDVSGRGTALTIINTAVFQRGISGTALQTGEGVGFTAPDSTAYNITDTGGLTVALWYWRGPDATGINLMARKRASNDIGTDYGWALFEDSGGVTFDYIYNDGATTQTDTVIVAGTIPTGIWTFIAAVVDVDAGTSKVWMDTTTATGNAPTHTLANGRPLEIGTDGTDIVAVELVRVYDDALSDSEIAALRAEGILLKQNSAGLTRGVGRGVRRSSRRSGGID